MVNRYQKRKVPTYGFELFGGNKDNDPVISELDEIHSGILSSVKGMDDSSYSDFISKGGLKRELTSLMAAINKRFGLNCVIGGETGIADKPIFSNFYLPFNLGSMFNSIFGDTKKIDEKTLADNQAALASQFSGTVDHINGVCKGIDNSESFIMISFNKLANLGVTARECTAMLMQEISGLFSMSDLCSRFSKGIGVLYELGNSFKNGLSAIKKQCLYKLSGLRLIDDADVKDLNEETNALFFTGKLLGSFIRRFKTVAMGLNPFSEIGKSINFVNLFGLTDLFKTGFNKVANLMGISTEGLLDEVFSRLAKAICVFIKHWLVALILTMIGIVFLIIPPIGFLILITSSVVHIIGIVKAILVLLTGEDDLNLFNEHKDAVNKSKISTKAKKAFMEQSSSLTTSALSKKGISDKSEFGIFNKIVATIGFSERGSNEEKGALSDLFNLSKSAVFQSIKGYIPFVGK